MSSDDTQAKIQVNEDARGLVIQVDDAECLQFTRVLPAPVLEVWAAITEYDRMGRWAFPGHIEPRTGGEVRFAASPAEPAEGVVHEWSEPHTLEYEWGEGDESWRLRFRLTAQARGTAMEFRHLQPDPTNAEYAAGWHWHLNRLHRYLTGGQPEVIDTDQEFDDLLALYSQQQTSHG